MENRYAIFPESISIEIDKGLWLLITQPNKTITLHGLANLQFRENNGQRWSVCEVEMIAIFYCPMFNCTYPYLISYVLLCKYSAIGFWIIVEQFCENIRECFTGINTLWSNDSLYTIWLNVVKLYFHKMAQL